MDEAADRHSRPSAKDILSAIRSALAVGRRYGYRISDEERSLAGYCCTVALRRFDPQRSKLATYVTTLFLRSLSRLRRWTYTEFDENAFIPRRSGGDLAQRLLLTFREPDQSICYAIWIERQEKGKVAKEFGVTLRDLAAKLDFYSQKLRTLLEEYG